MGSPGQHVDTVWARNFPTSEPRVTINNKLSHRAVEGGPYDFGRDPSMRETDLVELSVGVGDGREIISRLSRQTSAFAAGIMGSIVISLVFLFFAPDLDTLSSPDAPQLFTQIYVLVSGK